MRRRWLGRMFGTAGLMAVAWWGWTAAVDAGWFDTRAVPVADDVARAMLRDVKQWDAATSGERRGVAERVAKRLDAETAGFTLRRVRQFGFAGHLHEIAVFVHEATGLEFSLIPGGTFTMGSPESEADRLTNETEHEVTLTRPFLLARTECTQAVYERVTGKNPSTIPGSDRPVETVSWDAAAKFCAEVRLRLPTEAEWEFACRAGTTTRFWSGDAEADLARVGWYERNSDTTQEWLRWVLETVRGRPFSPGPRVVGSLPANPFGLHDVHGNVLEWCADWFGGAPPGPRTDPVGAPASGYRTLRGGSFHHAPAIARSAYRPGWLPDPGNVVVGFRPAKSVPEE